MSLLVRKRKGLNNKNWFRIRKIPSNSSSRYARIYQVFEYFIARVVLRRGVANEILKSQRCSHGNKEFSSRELGDTLYEANSQRRENIFPLFSNRKQPVETRFYRDDTIPPLVFIESNYVVESIGRIKKKGKKNIWNNTWKNC